MADQNKNKQVKIFHNHGGLGIYEQPKEKNSGRKAFITFVDTAAKTMFIGRAPIEQVTIEQITDVNAVKSFGSDYNLSVFGDQLANITITGMHIYTAACGNTTGKASASSMPDFYKQYKVSNTKNPRRVLSIGIAGLDNERPAFDCVITSLVMKATADTAISGYCTYQLHLLGVAR